MRLTVDRITEKSSQYAIPLVTFEDVLSNEIKPICPITKSRTETVLNNLAKCSMNLFSA